LLKNLQICKNFCIFVLQIANTEQMNKYIPSLRLRTLPLSMSGIILGGGFAWQYFSATGTAFAVSRYIVVFVLAILTTLSLQILSNLSNELGDALKGTDEQQQSRVAYGLQAGTLTYAEMMRFIGLFVVLSMIFGTALVLAAFRSLLCLQSILFLGLGLLAIIGAMTYTLGKHNYGYKGYGDIGVFLFFGLLSTIGSFYLQTQTVTLKVVQAAVAIGLPIVGVLNLNNIRDRENDILHGKRSFAARIGKPAATVYHAMLLAGCMALFAGIGCWYTLIALPVFVWQVWYIYTHDGKDLDKQMPVLMFTTIAIAVLAII